MGYADALSPGNARQAIFRDDADRRKLLEYLEDSDVWQGGMGGKVPASAYHRYMQQGIESPPVSPFEKAAHGWLLGSQAFVDRIRQQLKSPRFANEVPRDRTLEAVDVESVFAVVRDYFQVDAEFLGQRGDGHIARSTAAWLNRRVTTATLREVSVPLGLTRPESVSNLTGRMERVLPRDPKLKRDLTRLEFGLAQKTKIKV